MKRDLIQQLIKWADNPHRKPLLLNGVRQVGKTYLLKQFGAARFPQTHYFNFEKETELHAIFAKNLEPKRILSELKFYANHTIDEKRDLIIFDEIQACPSALTSLKYFQEEMPELSLASAGQSGGGGDIPAKALRPFSKLDKIFFTSSLFGLVF